MKNIDHEVHCPNCGWQHDQKKHWHCQCHNHWDALKTGGRCPECLKDHEEIKCPESAGGCGTKSPIMDWFGNLTEWLYHELHELNTSIRKEKERRGSRGL